MKKILIYYPSNLFGWTDFFGTNYNEIAAIVNKNQAGKFPNVGNKVWLQAIVSEINDGCNECFFGYEDISEEEINEKYDCVLMPLANCFHKGWIPYMNKRAEHIRKLTIPVFVIACGVQANSYDELDSLIDEIREPATQFISAVYNTGGEFALRGYFTAEFFERLGFKSAVVTGCPSLYQMGRNLEISNEKVRIEEFKAAINGTFKLPVFYKDIENADFIDQDIFGKTLFDFEYLKDNDFSFKRIWKLMRRGNIAQVKAFSKGKVKLFPNTNDWLNYYICNKVSFSFGSRIHGTIMPILAGVPSLIDAQDSRTREMAEFFNIPMFKNFAFDKDTDLPRMYELYQMTDYSKFNKEFKNKYDAFESFLIKNGLVTKMNQNNIFMKKDSTLSIPSAPNEEKLKRISRKSKMVENLVRTYDFLK